MKLMHIKHFALVAVAMALTACSAPQNTPQVPASNLPAPNPFLSAGVPSVTHTDPSASDTQSVAGPRETGTIAPERIKRVAGGLVTINYAGQIKYSDGVRAVWNANNNRVAKIRMDGDHWEELASLPIEGMDYMPPEEVNAHLAGFDRAADYAALTAYVGEHLPYYAETQAREAGIYTMADNRGEFYVLTRGEVLVYGDIKKGESSSGIEIKRRWAIPDALKRDAQAGELLKGRMSRLGMKLDAQMLAAFDNVRDYPLGINMTYDGHIAFSMIGGAVIIVDRDFARPARHHIIEGEILANSLSLDEDGGIYVVGDRNMHKLIWTGSALSDAADLGAWRSPYDFTPVPLPGVRGGGTGSGTTPTLMGFGEGEDHLVVIADGMERMNIVAFWRDDIPEDFTQKDGTRSRRIAGQMAATMGNLEARYIQTEVSIPVSGNYAFLVNGLAPKNIKPDLENLLVQGPFLAPPQGVEMMRWDHARHDWESVWADGSVSAPAAIIPLISSGSEQAYMIGWDDIGWNITGFGLADGAVETRMSLGRSQQFNGAWGQLQLLPDGDIFIPGLAGPVRILSADK
ncbi:MAG: hypothetical protein ACPGVT_08175 [Maricaulaceae bacterium]